jgi:hypothetical protein
MKVGSCFPHTAYHLPPDAASSSAFYLEPLTSDLHGYAADMTLFRNFSFWLQRAAYVRDVERMVKSGAVPVIVYQMGKVASTSITASLRRLRGLPVFHVHRLCRENIEALNARREQKEFTRLPVDAVGAKLAELVIDAGRPAKIITLVREPIGRNISAYFENLEERHGYKVYEQKSIASLIEDFLVRYPHSQPLTWFDKEFKKALGIDIYEFPFPLETGFSTISTAQFDVLVLRCDLPDDVKARCVGEFIGRSDFRLIQKNVSRDKPYAKQFLDFKENIRLPQAYVEKMLTSRFCCHFFGAEERDALRAKWLPVKEEV